MKLEISSMPRMSRVADINMGWAAHRPSSMANLHIVYEKIESVVKTHTNFYYIITSLLDEDNTNNSFRG